MSIEYEIRLYDAHSRRPLCFTRTETSGAAHALARRWQHSRPECRVLVVATSAPRPHAITDHFPIAS